MSAMADGLMGIAEFSGVDFSFPIFDACLLKCGIFRIPLRAAAALQ